MNCEELRRRLSEAKPLTAAQQGHLETCAGCRAMLDALDRTRVELEPQQLARIQARLAAGLKPVRPLPSDRVMIVWSVCLALVLVIAGSAVVGYAGLNALNAFQRAIYLPVLLLEMILLSSAVVHEIVPGSRRAVPSYVALALSLAGVALVAIGLFHKFTIHNFVAEGLTCFTIGSLSAFIAGLVAALLVRRGFLSAPVRAGAIAGALAGLVGVGILTVFCPLQNSAHVLVWHIGPMVGAAAIGAILPLFHGMFRNAGITSVKG
jgi:hypothetical protein